MKILWHSESPTMPTGFGNVTKNICEGLASSGIEVHIVTWEVAQDFVISNNLVLHRASHGGWGADSIRDLVLKLSPDFMVTYGDPTWISSIVRTGLDSDVRKRGGKWIAYYTLDGETADGLVPSNWIKMLGIADLCLTCSKYAVNLSEKSGLLADCIPHGVDISLFSPPPDKEKVKRSLGYDGKFVVLSDSRNTYRKMLPRLLSAFSIFARGKDDVILHLHTDPYDPWAKSNIVEIVKQLGISDKVRFTSGFRISKGIAMKDLAAIYQACDIHLLASAGEGFGIPTLQASSAGLLPMAVDYSANRELIEGHGELINVESYQIGRYGLKLALMDVRDCVAKLDKYYSDRRLLSETSKRARIFALDFSWPLVVKKWAELFEKFVSEVSEEKANPWVLSGDIEVGPRGLVGNEELLSAVRPFLQAPTGVKMRLSLVAPKREPVDANNTSVRHWKISPSRSKSQDPVKKKHGEERKAS